MSTRFEILKNGKRVCISGIDGVGVLSVIVDYAKRPDGEQSHELSIGGLGMFDGSQNRPQHASWPAPEVQPGDEITIRILPPGEFDEPHGMLRSPSKTLVDPEFGQLNFYAGSCDADIAFHSPPIESAHLHLRADESGPTEGQRAVIRELPARHARLWPDILAALVRCHPEIETSEELSKRLEPNLGIDLDADSNTVQLSYSVEGDPEFRGYFVTLRNWVIAEVCMAD
ncbi:MAG: hypothetical protein WD066_13800 [Planctomycetaceae bacterium]